MGKVYPGQIKPRFAIPEPRIQSLKNPFSLEGYQKRFRETETNDHIMPPKIIIVEPVLDLE